MSIPIVTTKLSIPLVRANLVPRAHLIERLNTGLTRKLTLVSAPAGFGKTTLVSSWLRHIDRPATWLSLDENDNDLTPFMIYLITALQTIDEHIGQAAQDMLQLPHTPPIELLTAELVNDIAAAVTEFIVVLDDYHVIDAQAIHQALNFLLLHAPPTMHLVITSRADPPLSLSRLRAQAQLHEVRVADLRFQPDEATLFLNHMMGLALSPDDVLALEQRTEGWAVGLQLAGLSLQGLSTIDKHHFVTAFAGDDRYIVDYLLEEVLYRQPPEIQAFLLQTSILDRLCGALCDAMLCHGAAERECGGEHTRAPSSSQNMVELLERANLFIVPLDHRREWYRYHHLFAELLRFHLHATYPERVDTLHLLASAWYKANGFATEAVKHALAARDFERAADLIEQIAQRVMSQGKLFTIQGWFQTLPDEIIQSRLRLAIYQIWTLFSTAQIESAEAWLRATEDTVSRNPTSRFARECDALRAFFAYNRGDFPTTITYAQQASRLLPQDDSFFHLFSTSLLGNAYRLHGDIASAVNVCRALSQYKQEGQPVVSAIMAMGNLVRLQMIQGQLRQAVQTYQQALQQQPVQPDTVTPLYGVTCIGMGEVLCEWNELEAAANHLRNGVALCQKWPALVEFLVDGVAGLVRVLQAQHDVDGAFSLIQEIEAQLTSQSTLFQWKLPRLAACRARLWLSPISFNLPAAVRWAETSGLTATDDPPYVYEYEYLTLARVLLAQGKLADALTLLASLERAAADADRMSSVIECLILQALAHQAHGHTSAALPTIEEALALAEPEGYIRMFVDVGEPMAALLGKMKEERGEQKHYAAKLLAAFTQPAATHHADRCPQPLAEPLSDRELDVLRFLNTHLSGPEIAEALTVSVNTVKTHMKHIYSKLAVSNRHAAVERAKELNLL